MTGAELRVRRARLGLTQGQLAPLVGIFGPSGAAKISDMERGVVAIPWKTAQLVRCYEFTGVEVAQRLAEESAA